MTSPGARLSGRSSTEALERRWMVRAGLGVDRVFCRRYHRLNLLAPCPIPPTGPAILVCNHTSGLDPALLQSACPRLICWMMAREYYQIGALGWIYRTIGAIPVERSGRDMPATRAALRALQAGRVLGVFPEGKIETAPRLLPFQVGVALLAIRSGAPVYPACLDGTQRNRDMMAAYLQRQRAILSFGPAVEFDRGNTERATLRDATQLIQSAVEDLRKAMRPA